MAPQVSLQDLAGRRDLRSLITFTIDGETARDFDDAVSLELLTNEHVLLGVHIADVSFYVHEGSPMDREASQRGTSVYFPDRVIPMLPARLSHDICCLQPEVDRLTLSVFIELTADARTVRYEIVDTVIRSQARLTYTRWPSIWTVTRVPSMAGIRPLVRYWSAWTIWRQSYASSAWPLVASTSISPRLISCSTPRARLILSCAPNAPGPC